MQRPMVGSFFNWQPHDATALKDSETSNCMMTNTTTTAKNVTNQHAGGFMVVVEIKQDRCGFLVKTLDSQLVPTDLPVECR